MPSFHALSFDADVNFDWTHPWITGYAKGMTYSHHRSLEKSVQTALTTFGATKLLVLTGPSGSGKTFLAEWLHRHGPQPKEPLLFQDAASLTDLRFESQLFGHVRGAFSGAVAPFSGLVGEVGKGTLVLEALEDLALNQQARLLRFIQERLYRPVGGVAEQVFDGRLILTSRLTLQALRAENRLRDDFFFRIASADLHLPPLEERPLDFLPLAQALVEKLKTILPTDSRWPTEVELRTLAGEAHPGNLHGLYNRLQQAALRGLPPLEVGEGTGPTALGLPRTGGLKSDLLQLEKQLLQRALNEHSGTREALADQLQISLRSLLYKLKEHGLS